MNTTTFPSITGTFRFLKQFQSRSLLFQQKLAELRKIREVAPLDELKKRYAEVYDIYISLSEHEQQRFQPQLAALLERIEEYLVAHQRMQILLHDLKRESIAELRERYDQLHLCLRQLPLGTQQWYYGDLIQVKDRLERGL